MGVYINMEMPPNCCQCPVNMEVCKRWYEYLLKHSELYDKRADDCPIVEIPPHGRLIDADAFLALVNDSTILSDFLKCIISPLIRGEPTVIEAEEGE